jgi:hypothetical protein
MFLLFILSFDFFFHIFLSFSRIIDNKVNRCFPQLGGVFWTYILLIYVLPLCKKHTRKTDREKIERSWKGDRRWRGVERRRRYYNDTWKGSSISARRKRKTERTREGRRKGAKEKEGKNG